MLNPVVAHLGGVAQGGWSVNYSQVVFPLAHRVVADCLKLVRQAACAFAPEATAAYQLSGQPTLVSRLDFTLLDDRAKAMSLPNPQHGMFPPLEGHVRPYEFEERPGGIGLLYQQSPDFHTRLKDVMQGWPQFGAVISPERTGFDDHLLVGSDAIWHHPQDVPPGMHVIVRAEPEETLFHPLASQSLSTVQTKGRKDYGQPLGWWTALTQAHLLPPKEAGILVAKSVQGSKTRGLYISPPGASVRQQGMITRAALERAVAQEIDRHGRIFIQPWHPPMQFDGQNVALRVFFGWSVERSDWMCLGGFYNVRKNAIIHGAQDTVFGPAIPAA